ncbi:hypothetical protein J2Z83_003947 [Virgibacillus natechei]|uniref:Uncharacterized protein n=1 Tax=Virgibacillus natechei TaxID=1216297 RepID=A0ABS4ILE4_9BACI|nr:hypothetical protein [Virgibacillus natechei]
MLIGFMRNNRKPFQMVRLLAKSSKYYNIDIIYFSVADVNIEDKTINGKMLINNKWVTKEVPYHHLLIFRPIVLNMKKSISF